MTLSAGHPVRLDPFQNIVNVQWPHDIVGMLDFRWPTAGQESHDSLGSVIDVIPSPALYARVIKPNRDLWIGDPNYAAAFFGSSSGFANSDPSGATYPPHSSGDFVIPKDLYRSKKRYVLNWIAATSTGVTIDYLHWVFLFNLSNLKRDFLTAQQLNGTDKTDEVTDSHKLRIMFGDAWQYQEVDGFGGALIFPSLAPFELRWKVFTGGEWKDTHSSGSDNSDIFHNVDGKDVLGTKKPHGTEPEEDFVLQGTRHHDFKLMNKIAAIDLDDWHMELVPERHSGSGTAG